MMAKSFGFIYEFIKTIKLFIVDDKKESQTFTFFHSDTFSSPVPV